MDEIHLTDVKNYLKKKKSMIAVKWYRNGPTWPMRCNAICANVGKVQNKASSFEIVETLIFN